MMFPMRYSFYEFLPFCITGCIRLVEYKAICNAYITLKTRLLMLYTIITIMVIISN